MGAFPKIHRVVVSICAAIERCAGALSLRQREPTRPYEVESLEQRRLLSRFNITWDEWEHSSPAFLAEIAALEHQYPRFAVLLNQDLAALQAESSSGAAVAAESAVLRGPLHHPRNHRVHQAHVKPAHRPKPPRHPKPAHNVKPHHPKPHRHGSSVTEALSPSGGPSVTANNFVYDPSLPHQFIFTFNEDVSGSLSSAGMSAISVIDLNTGSSVTPTSYTWTSGTKTATYGFSSALPDGNYAAVLHGSLIYDSSNVHLIGSDTINGHDYLATSSSDNGLFWFKNPDPNRDRSVGNDDASLIAAHFNMLGGYKQGDVDYSGTVNFNDLVIVDRAFGQSVPLLGSVTGSLFARAFSTSVQLTWNPASDPAVTSYDVYRDSQRLAAGVSATTFMDTGRSPGTSHTYMVVSRDANGDSSFASSPLFATTTTIAPATNLTARAVSSSEIDLAWTDSSQSATAYAVEHSIDGVYWSPIAMLAANATSYADTALADGTTYSYRVEAVGSAGYSDPAGPASATTTFAIPTILVAPAADSNPVTGASAILSVLGAVPRGEANLTYTWTVTSQPASAQPPTFSDNGTNSARQTVVAFNAAGSYTLNVLLTNGTATANSTASVTVNQTATTINVMPPAATVAQGQQQQFSATELDQFGNAMSTTPSFSWSVGSGGTGTIDAASGLYTAPNAWPASDTITASANGISGTALAATSEETLINFDDLAAGTVVTTQYPGVKFSGDPSYPNQVVGFSETSLPNSIGAPTPQSAGGDDLGNPYNHPLYVDFTFPVDGLSFNQFIDDSPVGTTIAQVRVFQNGQYSTTVPIISGTTLVDLSAYQRVTRIEIVNNTDPNGMVYDDFGFTPHNLRLAWNISETENGLDAFQVPLTGGQATPQPDTNDSHTLGDSNVSIDWGDGTAADNGSAPHFYDDEGTYTVTVTDNNFSPPTTTTFQVTVTDPADTEVPVAPPVGGAAPLAWTAIPNASSYDIYRGLAGSTGNLAYIGTTTSTSYSDTTAGSDASGYDQYQVVANTPSGPVGFLVLAAANPSPQNPTSTTPPPLVQSRTGTATSADDAPAIAYATAKCRADCVKTGTTFVAIRDLRITAKDIQLNGATLHAIDVVGVGTQDIPNVRKDPNGKLVSSGGYADALVVLKTLGKQAAVAPKDNGGGNFQVTLQDGTVVTLTKDGNWATLTVQRAGEPAVTITYIDTVRELNFSGPGGLNGNIDRIDNMDTMVEEKNAKGLRNPVNLNPDGSKKATETDWAKKQIFDKMNKRLTDLANATQTFKSTDPKKPYVGPNTPPTIDQVKAIKKVAFEIRGDWPELEQAVNTQIQNLKNAFPTYTFSVQFGVGPTTGP